MLLTRGNLAVGETIDESDPVSGHKGTDMLCDPEPPKTFFPSYRRGTQEVKPLVTPRGIVAMDHEGTERSLLYAVVRIEV